MNRIHIPSEAEALILKDLACSPKVELPSDRCLGRILRSALKADRPFPPFDRVTMDGIAFRSSDTQSDSLKLHSLHAAGSPEPAPLPNGHCFQIMTGAILPHDCDTVVPYEELTLSETHATILPSFTPRPGQFIHRQGSDAHTGDLLIPEKTRLNPAHLGLAASIGAITLQVSQAPKIQIFTTGDELIPMDQIPAPHQLRRSNGFTLQMALTQWGETETHLTHLPDALDATTDALATALPTHDLVILSGGISKGKKDYVRPALEALIGQPAFHGVAQRPGKPLAFWPPSPQTAAVFALPGNPNSTLTTFHRYLVPALNKMAGLAPSSELHLPLAAHHIPAHATLTQLLPAILNSHGELVLLAPQNSGDFLTPLPATHLVEIPPGPISTSARSFPLT